MIQQDCDGDDACEISDDEFDDDDSSAVAADEDNGDDDTSILLHPRIMSILTRMRLEHATISSCIAARIPGRICGSK